MELREKIQALTSEINKLTDERNLLRHQRLAEAPFKTGELVSVALKNGQTKNAFIGSTSVGVQGEFTYTFKQPKKDGTMSQISASIYSFHIVKIEKL